MARKDAAFPHLNHDTLTNRQQESFLKKPAERTKNLGHDWNENALTENPAGRPINYDSGDTERIMRDKGGQGVYGKFTPPKSGISTAENNATWGDRAEANSYTGHRAKAGPGKYPTMPDPRGRHSNASDGYLASTKNWPSFEYGSESGEGRLQKSRKY